jgi:hypothetical protein
VAKPSRHKKSLNSSERRQQQGFIILNAIEGGLGRVFLHFKWTLILTEMLLAHIHALNLMGSCFSSLMKMKAC